MLKMFDIYDGLATFYLRNLFDSPLLSESFSSTGDNKNVARVLHHVSRQSNRMSGHVKIQHLKMEKTTFIIVRNIFSSSF